VSRIPSTAVHSLPRIVATAISASTVGALPALLIGGLAVMVRADLGFDEFQLGAAISAFFAASIVFSVPAGMVSERIGPQRALLAGVAITSGAMLGIAAIAHTWLELVAWLFIAGTGNTIGQVGINHLLATAVRPGRQGLSYGVKQSSIPLAGMLAGLAVPVIGLTVGWRWAFVLGAAAVIVVFRLVGRPRPFARPTDRAFREGDAPIPALLVIAVAAGLGAAAGNALASFTVESAVARGFDAAAAGLLLTVGSLCGVSLRIVSGWIGDRLGRGSLLVVIVMQLVGVVGYLALSVAGTDEVATVLATMLAFGGGWGYQGLVLLAISRSNPTSPATAMAIVRLGPSTGAMLGPLAAGALVSQGGYEVTWTITAVLAGLAALLMFTGRILLLRHRRAVTIPGGTPPVSSSAPRSGH
jgi:MFS family permease